MLRVQGDDHGKRGEKEAGQAAAGAQVQQVQCISGQGNQQGRQRPVPPQARVMPEDGVGDEQVARHQAQDAAAEGLGRPRRQPPAPQGAEVPAKAADAAIPRQVVHQAQRPKSYGDEEVRGGNGRVEVVPAQPLKRVKELTGEDKDEAVYRGNVVLPEVGPAPLVAPGEPSRAAEAKGQGEDQDGEFQHRHFDIASGTNVRAPMLTAWATRSATSRNTWA